MLVDEWLVANARFREALTANEFQDAAECTDLSQEWLYAHSKSSVPDTIRWIRQNPKELMENFIFTTCEPFALINLSCETFIEQVLKSDDAIEFLALGRLVDGLRQELINRDKCPSGSSIILALIDLDKSIVAAQKRVSHNSGISVLSNSLFYY